MDRMQTWKDQTLQITRDRQTYKNLFTGMIIVINVLIIIVLIALFAVYWANEFFAPFSFKTFMWLIGAVLLISIITVMLVSYNRTRIVCLIGLISASTICIIHSSWILTEYVYVQGGFYPELFVWALPGIILIIVSTYLIISSAMKKSWKMANAAFSISLGSVLYLWIAILFLSSNLLPEGIPADDVRGLEEENRILSVFLRLENNDGYYAVIDPMIQPFNFGDTSDSESLARTMKTLKSTKFDKYEVPESLYERYVELNAGQHYHSLPSSIKDGYYFDYEYYFASLDASSFSARYTLYPLAGGWVTVSLPAYDEKSGYVLLYRGIQAAPLMGWGGICLYRYENDEFELIDQYPTWRS